MRFGHSLALSFSLALATAATPAFAEPSIQKQVVVSYGDLDLSQPAGVRALYGRIRAAARSACSPAAGRAAGQQVAWSKCRRDTLDRAVASLGSDAIARLHATRSSRGVSQRSS